MIEDLIQQIGIEKHEKNNFNGYFIRHCHRAWLDLDIG